MTLINPRFALLAAPAVLALALAACGGSKPPADTAATDTVGESGTATDVAPDAAPVDELAAREEELAKREAELALKEKEAELARREAELAAREKTASKPAATTTRPASSTASTSTAAKPVAAAPKPVVVPAGTTVSVEITQAVTTKTAKIGDAVVARLSQPLVVDGRTVAAAGAEVRGSVSDVYSGSHEVGGTPKLGIALSQLALANGTTAQISAGIVQEGTRESGKDAAKIAGGAVLGAVIGHQVDGGGAGKVVGGLLGAGAGAAAAKRTGGDIEVPAGTVIGFVLNAPFEMK
ncbi:MAG: hypothetical protein MUC71_00145 [Steroidobacteraceae bacterium]|jgi:hypothetical protein|nr:hypothetical protein [Steroidobacteraceae bacterium]